MLINPRISLTAADKDLIVQLEDQIDLAQTLDCGQTFRWETTDCKIFTGIVAAKVCRISHIDNRLIFHNTTRQEFETVWYEYFDFSRNYTQIKKRLAADPILKKATAFAPGLRLLHQDPWETLISFIISQNNHVPRIKGIISRLCALLGTPLGEGAFSFPSAQALAAKTPEDLAPIRAGFRAKYIIDAAQKVYSGEVDLSAVQTLPVEDARKELMKIKGVGVKVADCALLYGFSKMECMPVDVWIRRVLEQLYPQGLPECALEYPGIAQQFLFHYARTCPDAFPAE